MSNSDPRDDLIREMERARAQVSDQAVPRAKLDKIFIDQLVNQLSHTTQTTVGALGDLISEIKKHRQEMGRAVDATTRQTEEIGRAAAAAARQTDALVRWTKVMAIATAVLVLVTLFTSCRACSSAKTTHAVRASMTVYG